MRFGIDYGGTNIKTAVFSEAGEVFASDHTPLAAFVGDDLVGNLTAHASRVAAGHELSAGGIAVKGLVDTEAGCVVDDIGAGSLLAGIDLRAAFQEALGVPFAVENDARAYAWGEWRFGAGRGTRVMACITLGTGIGCALVAHGRPYAGADPLGGILGGHISIDRHGPECDCGQRGCFELFCSATALTARVRAAHPDLPQNDLLPGFFTAAASGEASYRATLDSYLDDLAIGVVNVIHAYGPERVVLGGGVMESAALILPGLTERVARRAWTVPRQRVALVAAELSHYAAALGAAFHPQLD